MVHDRMPACEHTAKHPTAWSSHALSTLPNCHHPPAAPPAPPAPHLGRLLSDVVQHACDRRLQRLVGVAAGRQLNQALAVLLDEVAALAVAARWEGSVRGGKAGEAGWLWRCSGAVNNSQHVWLACGRGDSLVAKCGTSNSSSSTVCPGGTHPVSRVLALASSSRGAGVTSSMPMEKPALPMKRALRQGVGRDGGASELGPGCAQQEAAVPDFAQTAKALPQAAAGWLATGKHPHPCGRPHGGQHRKRPACPRPHLSLARRFMHSAATRGL